MATCFCDVIPSIDNRTHILILQHVKERFHAFNTARIVKHALRNSALIVDQTSKLASTELPFDASTGVLYPGPGARLLSDVPAIERPQQLVILDGTWHHAKTFMRQIPALQNLPRYRLDPASPSNYRIRKEPSESALSTLEATVEALQALEPETAGVDQLLRAFDRMIDTQVQHPRQAGRLRLRNRPWNPPANIPYVLIQNIANVVVAYGEATYGRDDRRQKQQPVYWVAQRLGTGESFECAIQSPTAETPEFLKLLDLHQNDMAQALPAEDFCRAWHEFLRPTDTIAVFNESTARLLASVGADCAPAVFMKSVNVKRDCRTLDEVLMSLKLTPPEVPQKGRAGRRLANAIAFARYLHELGNSKAAGSMAGFESDVYPDAHD